MTDNRLKQPFASSPAIVLGIAMSLIAATLAIVLFNQNTRYPIASGSQSDLPQVGETFHHVLYHVSGSAPVAEIVFSDSSGNSISAGTVKLPWSFSRKSRTGDELRLSAQVQGHDGAITSEIFVDGIVKAKDTEQGEFAVSSAECRS